MAPPLSFKPSSSWPETARTGVLTCHGRKPIDTPHYIAITSRGVVPHLSQDVMNKHSDLKGVYYALEDFLDKPVNPPIIVLAGYDAEALRHFTSLANSTLAVLGPRRLPPVVCPMSSTGTALPVYTSVGFAMLEHEDYRDYALKLNPDIAIGLADMPYGDKPGVRRIQKMALRTEKWMKDFAQNSSTKSNTITTPSIFAPILLIEKGAQADYLELLETDLRDNIHGLAVYDTDSLAIIPKALSHLPRLALSDASKPQDVLRAIQLGADILAIPFINAATDAGIALCFTFPAPDKTTSADDARLPMGLDMWTTSHATDLSPLTADCTCYSCTKHHRAYIQHLLSAKEMLAWVLLQIHNLHIMDAFFQGIRRSITNVTFDDDVKAFNTAYEAELPEKTGQGPRIRGYQRKSEANDSKQNAVAYKSFLKDTNTAPQPDDVAGDAAVLEHKGFGETITQRS